MGADDWGPWPFLRLSSCLFLLNQCFSLDSLSGLSRGRMIISLEESISSFGASRRLVNLRLAEILATH